MEHRTNNAAAPSAEPGVADPGVADRLAALGLTARTGLQGKLVLCFIFLLASALGASCWLFASETREAFDRNADEQARQLARTLAMAGEPPLGRGDASELQRIGAELLKNKGMVAVAFFDAGGQQIAAAARDPDLERPGVGFFRCPREEPAVLQGTREGWTAALGRYVALTTPVVRLNAQAAAAGPGGTAARPAGQLIGYVTVCLSKGDADVRARNVALMVVLIGAVAVLVSLPTMYLLVHRIFAPIRELVAATDRIAGGDLDAAVAIDRPDVIGTLARSFNQMARRVRGQQHDLERANVELAHANQQLEAANALLEDTNGQLAEANWLLAVNNYELETRVADRTAELERANGRLNTEMADKNEFLRTVSHDLNAPLRNIAGMASMLLMKYRETFDPDVVYRLERIQKNVEVETSLIGELLELSRIKTRRQTFQDVDLGELVGEVAGLFSQDLETKAIALTVDGPLPRLTCERARVRQVFQNLVDNAIKYMGDGSGADAVRAAGHPVPEPATGADPVREIHVGCRVGGGGADGTGTTAGGGDVEFYVRDTGIGIDPADAPNVFRVFRRGTSQAVQSVPGKGVGLASVKSIVETYGGTIRAEGAIGVGTTFRFTVDRKHLVPAAGTPADVGTVRPPEGRAA